LDENRWARAGATVQRHIHEFFRRKGLKKDQIGISRVLVRLGVTGAFLQRSSMVRFSDQSDTEQPKKKINKELGSAQGPESEEQSQVRTGGNLRRLGSDRRSNLLNVK
jgi:topoisomerase IA-like protein